jgi:hypothetical protein
MDAHSLYPPTYVARGIERLQEGDVEWVSGPAIPEGHGHWSRRVALALGAAGRQSGSRKWAVQPGEGPGEIELDTGVFGGVWRRRTLEAHGGWDEGWPVNEDSEMAARVLAAGGRIVCLAELAARYQPRDSVLGLARQYSRYGFYRAKTARRHANSLRPQHLAAPGLVLALSAATLPSKPVRRCARLGLGTYFVGLAGMSAAAVRRPAPTELLGVAVVYMTMHLAFGAGFVAGCARFGMPAAALRDALRAGPGRQS